MHDVNEKDVKVRPATSVVLGPAVSIWFFHYTVVHDLPNVFTEFLRWEVTLPRLCPWWCHLAVRRTSYSPEGPSTTRLGSFRECQMSKFGNRWLKEFVEGSAQTRLPLKCLVTEAVCNLFLLFLLFVLLPFLWRDQCDSLCRVDRHRPAGTRQQTLLEWIGLLRAAASFQWSLQNIKVLVAHHLIQSFEGFL